MKFKALIGLFTAFTIAAIIAGAANYNVAEIQTRGTQKIVGITVAKAAFAEARGVLPAAATVTISRVSGVYTTTVATVVCTAGVGTAVAVSNSYLIAGDSLTQSGATNAAPVIRLIMEGD